MRAGQRIRIAACACERGLRGATGRIVAVVRGQLNWWWVALDQPPGRLALRYRDPAGAADTPAGAIVLPLCDIEPIESIEPNPQEIPQ